MITNQSAARMSAPGSERSWQPVRRLGAAILLLGSLLLLMIAQPVPTAGAQVKPDPTSEPVKQQPQQPAAVTFADINAGLPGLLWSRMTWGDYDSDGGLDFVLAGGLTFTSYYAALYHNNGNGSFSTVNAGLPTDELVLDLDWGDYDNDGKLDIWLLTDWSLWIYRNNGNGTFTATRTVTLAAGQVCMALGDYNNDGRTDVVLTGNDEFGLGYTDIYRNDANGSFTNINAGLPHYLSVSGSKAAWGDYNNDGWLDILIAGEMAGQVGVYRNNGNDTFTAAGGGFTGGGTGGLAWGDYDNDGWLDALVAGFENSGGSFIPRTRIYHNDHNGTFTAIDTILPGVEFGSVAWGDYDNDGKLDVLLLGGDFTRIYHNDGNGVFSDIQARACLQIGILPI